jgi:hypothetical protein
MLALGPTRIVSAPRNRSQGEPDGQQVAGHTPNLGVSSSRCIIGRVLPVHDSFANSFDPSRGRKEGAVFCLGHRIAS